MIEYDFINGDIDKINRLVKEGWSLVDTFPNPHPQPYFFALMQNDNHGWINCIENLPEKNELVLATDGKEAVIGYLYTENNWVLRVNYEIGPITHWMPLPHLPNKD